MSVGLQGSGAGISRRARPEDQASGYALPVWGTRSGSLNEEAEVGEVGGRTGTGLKVGGSREAGRSEGDHGEKGQNQTCRLRDLVQLGRQLGRLLVGILDAASAFGRRVIGCAGFAGGLGWRAAGMRFSRPGNL